MCNLHFQLTYMGWRCFTLYYSLVVKVWSPVQTNLFMRCTQTETRLVFISHVSSTLNTRLGTQKGLNKSFYAGEGFLLIQLLFPEHLLPAKMQWECTNKQNRTSASLELSSAEKMGLELGGGRPGHL